MVGPTLEIIGDLAKSIATLPVTARRQLIAVAGPPASGKSTLAAALVEHLNQNAKIAALIPMDGFHLDNHILTTRGLLARKGAPETFDAAGFIHMIQRLATEDEVVIPVFDRAQDIAIAGAQSVGADTKIAVVEGNYLLLTEPPWECLQAFWDLSIYLDVPLDEIERRSVQRWLDHDMSPEDAVARARSNDVPNAVRVSRNNTSADIIL